MAINVKFNVLDGDDPDRDEVEVLFITDLPFDDDKVVAVDTDSLPNLRLSLNGNARRMGTTSPFDDVDYGLRVMATRALELYGASRVDFGVVLPGPVVIEEEPPSDSFLIDEDEPEEEELPTPPTLTTIVTFPPKAISFHTEPADEFTPNSWRPLIVDDLHTTRSLLETIQAQVIAKGSDLVYAIDHQAAAGVEVPGVLVLGKVRHR